MNLSDYVLSTLGVYGLPVLFIALFVGCVGVPLPSSLMLLVAGSFVEQGELSLWPVLSLSIAGSVLGDNLGYALGRWGGGPLNKRLGRTFGKRRFKRAEEWLKRHEGIGVFLTRWLFTPLGPVVNITCGITAYSWPRFLIYDFAGEALWVVIYVMLGKFFSDRVQELEGILGDFAWMLVGLLFVVVLGWALFQYLRSPARPKAKAPTPSRRVGESP